MLSHPRAKRSDTKTREKAAVHLWPGDPRNDRPKSTNSAARLETFPPSTVPPRSSICVVPPISCKRNAIIEPIHRHVNVASQLHWPRLAGVRSLGVTLPRARQVKNISRFRPVHSPLPRTPREKRSPSTTAPRAVARHRVPTSHSPGAPRRSTSTRSSDIPRHLRP